ncbi:hypothetical protein J6590_007855, partial [Homalodisca vitripennis]
MVAGNVERWTQHTTPYFYANDERKRKGAHEELEFKSSNSSGQYFAPLLKNSDTWNATRRF